MNPDRWTPDPNEPLLHTGHTDCLPDGHPLKHEAVFCDDCGVMVHAFNNECMRGWVEMRDTIRTSDGDRQRGNYCLACFVAADEYPLPSGYWDEPTGGEKAP